MVPNVSFGVVPNVSQTPLWAVPNVPHTPFWDKFRMKCYREENRGVRDPVHPSSVHGPPGDLRSGSIDVDSMASEANTMTWGPDRNSAGFGLSAGKTIRNKGGQGQGGQGQGGQGQGGPSGSGSGSGSGSSGSGTGPGSSGGQSGQGGSGQQPGASGGQGQSSGQATPTPGVLRRFMRIFNRSNQRPTQRPGSN